MLSGGRGSQLGPAMGAALPSVVAPVAVRRPENMSAWYAIAAILVYVVFRLLHLARSPKAPVLRGKDQKYVQYLLKQCPMLTEIYCPPKLWGRSGHFQSVIHSLVGRVRCPKAANGDRIALYASDGALFTYELYKPYHDNGKEVILAVCPGIGNSSETLYIQAFVHYIQIKGLHCAVLNHIGTLSNVQPTTPRIFSYGHTEEFQLMVDDLCDRYPDSQIVCIGFSMGGNIVSKYLGSCPTIPSQIVGGISVCQGYDATRAMNHLLDWENLRRVYFYIMTEWMKALIMRHKSLLLSPIVKDKYGLEETRIVSAATMIELDEEYSRKVHGFDSVMDFYRHQSSAYFLDQIKHPMVFVNALDDPIVPPPLLDCIREHASAHEKVLYIETEFGGHLGFFEGGIILPKPHSWMDHLIVQISNALTEQPQLMKATS
ncbi:unnamed protein product [Darwinula stevensoni]|uniref:AB hydrolase-1 domain-containing protein n=1 Tax=Darwinula stevensoni TaxID=69355 RepID=A0A7R8XEW9_9CRUS|nr:unnamed protein product [Darwinula stevensoni]CAG0889994.1 unnamed protein product [Darwinula stevensoni]